MRVDPKCQKFLKKVGARIRKLRLDRGWTLEQTEDHGWPAWRHLQQIEAGKNVTLATIWNIAKLLDVSPDEILKVE